MTARLHRLALAVLVALAALWAAWWLARGQTWLALVGAGVIALLHVPALALEFVLVQAANRGDSTPRAHGHEMLRAWWNECRLGVLVFAWRQPFRSKAIADNVPVMNDALGASRSGASVGGPSRTASADTPRGVVLVHGFMCNRGLWNAWMPRLAARGVPFIAVNLEPPFGDIDDYAATVDAAARRLRDATGLAPVIVGHSMGGLAARAWLRTLRRRDLAQHVQPGLVVEAARLEPHAVITLGTPHHGTAMGRLWPMRNVMQMRRLSSWLAELERSESAHDRERFTCFYSHCDNIVLPASSAMLEGARNVHVRATAHVQLIEPAEVFDAVMAAVTQPADNAAAAPSTGQAHEADPTEPGKKMSHSKVAPEVP